ncbi:MAG: 2-oxo acid dehydrogenase subunit E2 [Actinomycetes bacterium]
MAKLLRMPEIAANTTEVVLQSWSLAEGADYLAHDTIATIETEKAVVDVDADEAGRLLKILVAAGTNVEVGTPIALIGSTGESVSDLTALLTELGITSATSPVPESESHISTPAPASQGPTTRIFASPLARRLAREAGLDTANLIGTGPQGRILRRDVAAAGADAVAAPAPLVAAPIPAVATPPTLDGASTDVPHTRMRRAIARRLTESKSSVPHFYLRATCNVDALLAAREQLNAVSSTRISVNDLVIKAAAWAHVLVPKVNVTWGDDAIRQYNSVDIAVAVATETGLLTPVLRSVETLPIAAVAAQTKDFALRAREGRLKQDELEGGTLSISNLGMYGTEEFAAIINPPQAAILAVGAARQEPVVTDGVLAVATVMRVTLSVDHRSVDGALAAQWLKVFVSLIENPVRILA